MKWNDPKIISTSEGYLRLKPGENRLRIVSDAEVLAKHFDPVQKKTTVCIGKEKGCKGCEENNKPRVQWVCWAIDRRDERIKLFEAGYSIIQQVTKLAQTEEYGFETIPSYDITIMKEGEGLETEYSVIPARKDTPLTDNEKDQISELQPIAEIVEQKKKRVLEEEPF